MGEMKKMQQALDKLPSFAEPVPEFIHKPNMKPLRFGSLGSIFTRGRTADNFFSHGVSPKR